MTEQELVELCSLGENTMVQFVARIWRTTQKDETTTQKANEELFVVAQKDEFTTQKSDSTTQKPLTTAQKPLTTAQKAIMNYLKDHPKATRKEVAIVLGGISEDGVKFNIGRLEQYGLLKRKDGRKNGYWVVTLQ